MTIRYAHLTLKHLSAAVSVLDADCGLAALAKKGAALKATPLICPAPDAGHSLQKSNLVARVRDFPREERPETGYTHR